ncbi:aspartyl-phosphate phosphatase Spo0E family protein [Neobacillus bataviensis]|uniref:aspartyl-phosphate phosphatase Spo0E family protein n=1 Tax=Neobacillus bataviensis TaxID=220685 RepID=UPI001CBD8D97|nr:aspartyl-phosphate phosphatase Spo0E family protein [Neobacillus bataviensis]
MGARLEGLLAEIESCRMDMVRLASVNSFAHHEVIEASRRLDSLLNEYSSLVEK